MLISIPEKIYQMCQSKKYIWSPQHKELIRSGLMWEAATQLFLGVHEDGVKLRESKKGADNGIDTIIHGNKIQCKSCLFDGVKNFILLDKVFNLDCDFYSLGKVYEDYRQAELIALIKTSEMMSFVDIGKIAWHEEYSKWFFVLASGNSWFENQKNKKNIQEGVIQNIKCFVYNSQNNKQQHDNSNHQFKKKKKIIQ